MAIKNTGNLRAFVAKAMEDLRKGEVKYETAAMVVKMAGRITESLYAEAKIQRLVIETGREPEQLGHLRIGDEAPTITAAA